MSKPPGGGCCSCTRRLYALVLCVVLLAGAAVTLLSWTETRTDAAGRFLSDSQIPELLRHHFRIDGLRAYLKRSRAGSSSSSSSWRGGNGGVSGSSSSRSSRSIGFSSSDRNSSSLGSGSIAAAIELLGADSLASAVAGLAAAAAPAHRTQPGRQNVTGLPSAAVGAAKPAAAVLKPPPPQAAAKPAAPAAAEPVFKPPPPPAAAAKPAAAAAVAKPSLPLPAAGKPAAAKSAVVKQPPPSPAAAAKPAAAPKVAAASPPAPTAAARSKSSSSSSCGCWRADPQQLTRVCSVAPIRWPGDAESLIGNCTSMLATNTPAYMSWQQPDDPAHNVSCSEQLLLHTYWAGPMTWKLKAVIQSFLFTHYAPDSSCRPKPVLNVWLAEQPTRQLLQQWAKQWAATYLLCSDQLQFRHWTNDVWLDWIPDAFAERLSTDNVTVTPAALRRAVSATAAPGSKVGYSDAVRFFVLYKYGGVYTDGDVLLLRSMQPLAHLDFLYEWSFVRGGTNTAVFSLRRRSRFAAAVIQHALRQALRVNGTTGQLAFDVRVFASLFHPLWALKRVPAEAREGVHTLPSLLFDPVWLALDANATKKHHPNNHTALHRVRAWADVFVAPPAHLTLPASARDFFRGAFAHHWHNNWGQPLEPRSMMGQWVALYDRFLAGQEPGADGAARYEDCSAAPPAS